MENLPINFFDIAVLVILALSGILAFSRGMAREVLKLAAWIGAGFTAIYGFAYARPFARELVPVEFLADTAAGVGIFLLALVILSFLANFIAEHFRDSGLNALDRSLGFVFGVARGVVVVSLSYLFLVWIVKGENLPDWVIEAKTRPFVERGAALLVQIAPRGLRHEAEATAETARIRARQAIEAERKVRELSQPLPTGGGAEKRSGYDKGERKEMERLIQGNQ